MTSCFDTLPQDVVLDLVNKLFRTEEYHVARHTELKPADCTGVPMAQTPPKPRKSFRSTAYNPCKFGGFEETMARRIQKGCSQGIFNDAVVRQPLSRTEAMDLLQKHVKQHVVKIGKRFYRQRQGIPQGSVLSTMLCNTAYAAFERDRLGFLSSGESLLMRLIDDFLLITTSRSEAIRFLQVMHDGDSKYGISVRPEKSLASFAAGVNDKPIPQAKARGFPYCGLRIDKDNLELTKDASMMERTKTHWTPKGRGMRLALRVADMSDTLTVEFSRAPGQTFRRKIKK